jgi:hypothetical protein
MRTRNRNPGLARQWNSGAYRLQLDQGRDAGTEQGSFGDRAGLPCPIGQGSLANMDVRMMDRECSERNSERPRSARLRLVPTGIVGTNFRFFRNIWRRTLNF